MERLLALLQSGELIVHGQVPWSSNYTFVVVACLDDREAMAIYKPVRGERPLWDFPPETLARREVAAYVVSESLGWGFVPPTVLRTEAPHGPGSVQLYIDADPEDHYFNFSAEEKKCLGRVVAFDVLLNNADRKSGHVIKDRRGKVWLIDHGICFHADPKLRTVIWDLAGEPLPADVLADIRRFQNALENDRQLRDRLTPLLSPREFRALQRRAAGLIEYPCYPTPGPGRNYPWPPV